MSTKPGTALGVMRFGTLRPLQQAINSTTLEEKVVLALMSTDGGKSLRTGFRHCP